MVMAEADADTAATEFLHFPVFVVFVGDLQGNLQSRGTSASSSTGKLQVNLFKDLKVLQHLSRRNLLKTVLCPRFAQDPTVRLPWPQTSPEAAQGMVVGQDEGCAMV